MIRRVHGGYVVVSEAGKRLSRVYPRRADAARRLHEIEYFKHRDQAGRRPRGRG